MTGENPFAGASLTVTRRCDVCGHALEMALTSPSRCESYRVMCACEMRADEDPRARDALRRRAFGSRVAMGSFHADDGRCQEASEVARSYARGFHELRKRDVNGLLLHGPARRGKTFLAEAVCNALLHHGAVPLMVTAAEVVQAHQSGSKEDVARLSDRVASCALLAIDDLGAERSTGFGREVVFSLIDRAYSERKPMLVTTNMTPDQMAEADDMHGQRLWGRIRERCFPVEVACDMPNLESGYDEFAEALRSV